MRATIPRGGSRPRGGRHQVRAQIDRDLKAKGVIAEEELPGDKAQSDDDLRDFVKYQSWEHHASCTCPIGREGDPMAVLDRNFKVRGTPNLRIVDASIFPKIPGFFIVSSVYMAAEKAAEVILTEFTD
jgi:choline dehydrogenase-like flavoprotein